MSVHVVSFVAKMEQTMVLRGKVDCGSGLRRRVGGVCDLWVRLPSWLRSNYLSSKSLLLSALSINEKVYGTDHVQVAFTLTHLGITCSFLGGEYGSSKKHLERSLLIFEKNCGSDHIYVAVSLRNLGDAYERLGEYGNSKKYLERFLLIEEKFYGKDDSINTGENL